LGKRKFVWSKKIGFTCRFWVGREEMSVVKRTNHDMFEKKHCLVVYYVGNETYVPVKHVVSM